MGVVLVGARTNANCLLEKGNSLHVKTETYDIVCVQKGRKEQRANLFYSL